MQVDFAVFRSRFGLWIALLATGLLAVAGPGDRSLADEAPPPPPYVPREMADIQTLVAPIALYPDALLAQVLTASTYPADIIAATQWEDAGNDLATVDAQPWDASVKGIAHYPPVLHYLATNAPWMNELGDAFLHQQQDVMNAVQILRAKALAAGTLTSTPQQTVTNDGGYIQIIPASPTVIYVPTYNPQVVYAPPPEVPGDTYPLYITYGPPLVVGDWLNCDLDWYDRAIYFGNWGSNRPWWHYRDHPGLHTYIDHRPGHFLDDAGHLAVAGAIWRRDAGRPAPRPAPRPVVTRSIGRPERGYPSPAQVFRPAPDVSREVNRGVESRERAAPVARPPEVIRPAREAPRVEARPPEARPSAPVRGGAVRGYQNGAAAAHSASRGAASRGGGGGRR